MQRWTRLILRRRWLVLAVWLAVTLAGGFASTRLGGLLRRAAQRLARRTQAALSSR